MANYQAAKALMGKENSELRNSSRARRVRERGSRAKKGARKSAVKKGETKEMTLAITGFVSQDMLTDPFFFFLLAALMLGVCDYLKSLCFMKPSSPLVTSTCQNASYCRVKIC